MPADDGGDLSHLARFAEAIETRHQGILERGGHLAVFARRFHDDAPTTAAAAATIILDGVKAGRWRILVGEDAHRLDERVRAAPEEAYGPEFFASFAKEAGWRLGS